jgi:hypothetical protein
MAPVVLTELLSDPKLPSAIARTLFEVPAMEIAPGYWQRAGALRAEVLAKRRKARLGDALIAQSCIDRGPCSRGTETSAPSPTPRALILCCHSDGIKVRLIGSAEGFGCVAPRLDFQPAHSPGARQP